MPGKPAVADIVDKATRSRMMSGIRGKDTKPERELRRALHRRGLRYRLHARDLPGRPDIVLPRFRAVLLVHGCFWHRHERCSFATTPSSNVAFWMSKFSGTMDRDKRNVRSLLERGWRVGVVWECAIRSSDGAEVVATGIQAWLRSSKAYTEVPPLGRRRVSDAHSR